MECKLRTSADECVNGISSTHTPMGFIEKLCFVFGTPAWITVFVSLGFIVSGIVNLVISVPSIDILDLVVPVIGIVLLVYCRNEWVGALWAPLVCIRSGLCHGQSEYQIAESESRQSAYVIEHYGLALFELEMLQERSSSGDIISVSIQNMLTKSTRFRMKNTGGEELPKCRFVIGKRGALNRSELHLSIDHSRGATIGVRLKSIGCSIRTVI